MIRNGMKREEINPADIHATTFHPFKDIWWIVCEVDCSPAIAITENGIVTDILRFTSKEQAMQRFQELWENSK